MRRYLSPLQIYQDITETKQKQLDHIQISLMKAGWQQAVSTNRRPVKHRRYVLLYIDYLST